MVELQVGENAAFGHKSPGSSRQFAQKHPPNTERACIRQRQRRRPRSFTWAGQAALPRSRSGTPIPARGDGIISDGGVIRVQVGALTVQHMAKSPAWRCLQPKSG